MRGLAARWQVTSGVSVITAALPVRSSPVQRSASYQTRKGPSYIFV
ncbi:hypothetical protein LJR255_001108 [Pararhizobium sp. LjRoot255]